jgi:hypothetical protein
MGQKTKQLTCTHEPHFRSSKVDRIMPPWNQFLKLDLKLSQGEYFKMELAPFKSDHLRLSNTWQDWSKNHENQNDVTTLHGVEIEF